MKKILYIVSTLGRSEPTKQLLNIIKNLDHSKYQALVLTLSPEPSNSRFSEYINAGLRLEILNMSRFQGLFSSKKKIEKIINDYKPDIIHTQGIRVDSLMSTIQPKPPWIKIVLVLFLLSNNFAIRV
ncbi:hypothetical protein NX722_11270 [Endozoicomonas gorgoniicola]|uniref:Glycosyltransferase subfamily 4-like N-terminal domain-containing protein n=1 Tax=Endozoicomonas gorgoniicola TaxID=1234144 RepID=A0ABT3MV17_9GAMM|nr:hypothetical protein [Endozoicomonas gorgoniicola]MCW7553208.1 hypothetical protein [Endozoicomonas gorgoniicola]